MVIKEVSDTAKENQSQIPMTRLSDTPTDASASTLRGHTIEE